MGTVVLSGDVEVGDAEETPRGEHGEGVVDGGHVGGDHWREKQGGERGFNCRATLSATKVLCHLQIAFEASRPLIA